ncbi:hypothetical protein GPSY_1645 [Paraglaciecola psychrophila 170]|nr:hypothetical protein GPSY_1645 [Paraglaciecola psychrophila 170]
MNFFVSQFSTVSEFINFLYPLNFTHQIKLVLSYSRFVV